MQSLNPQNNIITCPCCDGQGKVERWTEYGDLEGDYEVELCPDCMGSGTVHVQDILADYRKGTQPYEPIHTLPKGFF